MNGFQFFEATCLEIIEDSNIKNQFTHYFKQNFKKSNAITFKKY